MRSVEAAVAKVLLWVLDSEAGQRLIAASDQMLTETGLPVSAQRWPAKADACLHIAKVKICALATKVHKLAVQG